MFVKLTRSGGHTYAQLVESFRDAAGQPRQRTVTTLGRVDESGGQLDAVLSSLLRAKGRPADVAAPQIRFESALALGDVWALDQLWRELGFDALAGVFRRARYTTPVEQAIRVMVFNRLCDPTSKLGVMRWLEGSRVPAVDAASVTHQRLLRAMDTLAERAEAMQRSLATLLRPLIDQELSVVFYDLTTVGVEGHTELAGDVRALGKAKDGGIDSLRRYFPNIARAYLIGASAESFAATLDGHVPFEISGTLDKAVADAARDAAAHGGTGEVCVLLSPACASYDQFQNFEHRGDVFRKLVAALP